MSDSFDKLELVGRRVPDFSVETDPNGHKYTVELPGTYEVGFQLGGVFRSLVSLKAGGLMADLERAKASAPAEPAPVE